MQEFWAAHVSHWKVFNALEVGAWLLVVHGADGSKANFWLRYWLSCQGSFLRVWTVVGADLKNWAALLARRLAKFSSRLQSAIDSYVLAGPRLHVSRLNSALDWFVETWSSFKPTLTLTIVGKPSLKALQHCCLGPFLLIHHFLGALRIGWSLNHRWSRIWVICIFCLRLRSWDMMVHEQRRLLMPRYLAPRPSTSHWANLCRIKMRRAHVIIISIMLWILVHLATLLANTLDCKSIALPGLGSCWAIDLLLVHVDCDLRVWRISWSIVVELSIARILSIGSNVNLTKWILLIQVGGRLVILNNWGNRIIKLDLLLAIEMYLRLKASSYGAAWYIHHSFLQRVNLICILSRRHLVDGFSLNSNSSKSWMRIVKALVESSTFLAMLCALWSLRVSHGAWQSGSFTCCRHDARKGPVVSDGHCISWEATVAWIVMQTTSRWQPHLLPWIVQAVPLHDSSIDLAFIHTSAQVATEAVRQAGMVLQLAIVSRRTIIWIIHTLLY